MNCKKCGNALLNTDQFCTNCGEPNESFNVSLEPAAPVVPEVPVTPVEPAAPVVPEVPVTPVEPAAPVVPEVPVTPVEPSAPVVPEVPDTPVEPAAPVVPEVPVTPVEPAPIPMQTPANPINQTTTTPVAPAAPVTQSKPKKNMLFIIVIIIMTLVIIGLGVFIAIKLLNNTDTQDNPRNAQQVEPKPTEVSTANETINFGGLTFTIPSGLEKKTLDGYNVLVDKTNGFMFFLDGLSNEVSESIIKSQYPSVESKYRDNITSQGGTYIGASEYVLNGRTYFGISYYVKNMYSDIVYTEITDDYLFMGEIIYASSSKDVAYKALNEFLNSAESQKAGSFAKNIEKNQLLNGSVTVRDEIE